METENSPIFSSPAFARREVEEQWYREKNTASPKPLLRSLLDFFQLDGADAPAPDLAYVHALREIHPDLRVHWVGRYKRWGIFLNKRTNMIIRDGRETYLEFDECPMLVDLIQDFKGNYMPLSPRTLPELNMDSLDVHKYLIKLRQAGMDKERRREQKRADLWRYAKKQVIPIMRRDFRHLTGDVPNTTVFIPNKKGNVWHGKEIKQTATN